MATAISELIRLIEAAGRRIAAGRLGRACSGRAAGLEGAQIASAVHRNAVHRRERAAALREQPARLLVERRLQRAE